MTAGREAEIGLPLFATTSICMCARKNAERVVCLRGSLRILIVTVLLVTQAYAASAGAATAPLSGLVVCIDPGHQATVDLRPEPIAPGSLTTKPRNVGGTRGVQSGTPEHVIALEISLLLKEMLEEAGASVVMTRMDANVHHGNVERAEIANRCGADLFIRVHCDGSSNSARSGTSVLYPSARVARSEAVFEQSRRAAGLVLDGLVRSCRRNNLGTVARDDLVGFNWSEVPVILPEVAFLTNPEEDALLNTPEFRENAARGIYAGVIRHFAGDAPVGTTPPPCP